MSDRSNHVRRTALSTLIGVLLCSTAAIAQGVSSPPPTASASDNNAGKSLIDDNIVVTARRREERLQDVPAAVTVVGAAQIQAQSITRVNDVARSVAGLQLTPSTLGNSLPLFTIRSQRQADAILTNDPSVSVYFADVVQARPHGINGSMFDIAAVQVLKGPQGTLFGRNSTGGAILITPQAPTTKFEGYVQGALGNYDLRRFEAVVNAPLTDTLQVRLGGQITRRDGYVRALTTGGRIDNERTESWRASVRWRPTAGLTNDLVLSGFHENDAGVPYKTLALRPGGPALALFPDLVNEFAFLNSQPYHSSTIRVDKHGTIVRTFSLSNITTVDLGSATIKNIFGYRDVHSISTFNIDGSSRNIFTNREALDAKQYSDELQLSGVALERNLNYIVGLYYFLEKGHDRQIAVPLFVINDVNAFATNISKSVFAQVTYKLPFAPSVSLTAGGRYTEDMRHRTQRSFRAGVCRLVNADVGGVPLNPCERTNDATFREPTYTITADWKISRNVLAYVAHRRGYRSGGFNFSANSPSEARAYLPEIVSDYEIGLKNDINVGNLRARLNVAAYHQDYKDIQRQALIPGTVRTTTLNAASATINGFEAEFLLIPVNGLELGLNYAYSKPKYNKFIVNNTLDYTNSPFAGAPRHSINGHVRYEIDTGHTGKLSAQLDGYYQSSTYQQDLGSFDPVTQTRLPTNFLPGYELFNSRLQWDDPFGVNMMVAFFIRNLADKKYIAFRSDVYNALGIASGTVGAPRTFGVEARYRF